MRWFVEISPLGASEGQKQKWCLEASGWQPALKDARSIRGEEGPLGGFSIELLDDGARAVDPVTRIRYVIRSAPDDTALTHVKDGAGKSTAVKADPASAPAPKSEPAKSEPAKSEPAKSEAPRSEPAKSEPGKVELAKVEPAKSDLAKVEPVKSDLAKVEPAKSDLVKVEPTKSDLVKVEAPSDDVEIPVDEDGGSDEASPLPTYQLLQAREENPSERSPLTYREYVYAVDAGTPDAEIERVLHARFAAVKEALASATQGRFVNLAIFDHVFTGKPKKRPRATLTWKDWRGAPEIHFPTAERASLEPPSFTAPTSFSKPIPQPSIPPAEPLSAVPSTAVAPTEPAPAKLVVQAPEPTPAASPAPEPTPAVEPTPAPVVSIVPPVVSNAGPVVSSAPPTPAATTAPSPTAPLPAEPLAIKIEAPAKVTIEAAPAVSVAQPAPPVSAAPKTMPAAAPQPAPAAPARREAYIPPVKTAAQAGKRMAGDELISELFEACGDLQFLRDSLEGADFVLSLALEKLPSELGLVSLFDINRREFVVVRQAGGPKSIVLARLPERAGLAQAAMRKTSAIVVPDASKEPRALDDRIRALGIQLTSVMIAPVEVSGRYLGLIELVNPTDGRAFTEGDGHALTYIGEQYAEFVAERGVVLDPESVIERHQKR